MLALNMHELEAALRVRNIVRGLPCGKESRRLIAQTGPGVKENPIPKAREGEGTDAYQADVNLQSATISRLAEGCFK